MRQRRIKNLDEKLSKCEKYAIYNPKANKGTWKRIFGNDNPIYLEIGCGKGQFITNYALARPNWNFIAVEGHQSVVLRALEKSESLECRNVKFISEYIRDICDYFDDGEIAGIFLNFSDPWPKDRHAKRRLTHGNNLKRYCRVISNDGNIQFKTDNDKLFDFTLGEIERCNLKTLSLTRNLHNSEFSEANITTEYEDKFAATGKNINYVKCSCA